MYINNEVLKWNVHVNTIIDNGLNDVYGIMFGGFRG